MSFREGRKRNLMLKSKDNEAQAIPWRQMGILREGLPKRLDILSGIEASTVLVLANGLMRYALEESYQAFAADPQQYAGKKEHLITHIMHGILGARAGLVEAGRMAGGNIRRYVICHLVALDVLLLTLAGALRNAQWPQSLENWHRLFAKASSARSAITFIRAFESAKGVPALPSLDGRAHSDTLLRQMHSLPLFCRQ